MRVLRPDGKGGLATTAVFATGRYRPFGIAFYPPGPNPAWVYVADNDKVVRYAYANGDLTARGPAQTVVPGLPQGGQLPGGGHWTRDLAFARDGSRLYVSVGSFSNDQNEARTTPDAPTCSPSPPTAPAGRSSRTASATRSASRSSRARASCGRP